MRVCPTGMGIVDGVFEGMTEQWFADEKLWRWRCALYFNIGNSYWNTGFEGLNLTKLWEDKFPLFWSGERSCISKNIQSFQGFKHIVVFRSYIKRSSWLVLNCCLHRYIGHKQVKCGGWRTIATKHQLIELTVVSIPY